MKVKSLSRVRLLVTPWSIAAATAAARSLQSCLTLSDRMDCSPPGSSIHGIFQAGILEWGAIAFSMQNARRDESQAGIKIYRRNSNNLRYTDDTILMAESEEELKSLLMRVKEKSGKVGRKLNIQKTNIMASGPITSWQIEGENLEIVTDFLF